MNLGRVKTFLIVLFLGINVYLLLSTASSSEFVIDDKTVENTISILNSANISIDKAAIPKNCKNIKNIETVNTVYKENLKNANVSKLFKIDGDRFTCKVKSGIYKDGDKKVVKEVKSFLADCGFDTGFMNFSPVKTKNGKKTFSITCSVKGFKVFDSVINVCVTNGAFTLDGVWYEPQSTSVMSKSTSRKNVYVTSVLIDFSANEKVKSLAPLAVKSVEQGYMSGSIYGKTGHLTATALPYYRITDSKGNVYYYDAQDGTYLN